MDVHSRSSATHPAHANVIVAKPVTWEDLAVAFADEGVGVPPGEQCLQDCRGAVLPGYGRCLGHLDPPELDKELARFGIDGALDARGVRISPELLGRIFAAVPRDADGHPSPWEPRFDGATFGDEARLTEQTFSKNASFIKATFANGATFDGVTFEHGAKFAGATFGDRASFIHATLGSADFSGATFGDDAEFAWQTSSTLGSVGRPSGTAPASARRSSES